MPLNIEKTYLPMTESMYYILLSLMEPRHGYGVILHVREITGGRLSLMAGTVYNSISKMLRDGLIAQAEEDDRRKIYIITDDGRSLLKKEIARLNELVENGKSI